MNRFIQEIMLLGVVALFAVPSFTVAAQGGQAKSDSSGELVNRVRYVVGDIPITEIDIQEAMEHIRGSGKRDRAVEKLINQAIVDMEARRQSIIVSDDRIENEINKRMEVSGLNDRERFEKTVARETGKPFAVWKEELRYELKRRQLMQISVNVPMPDQEEIQRFYRKNRARFGYEVSYREIVFPSTSSISQERAISTQANRVYRKLSLDPGVFSRVARTLPENISPMKGAGGLYTYRSIQEVAARSQVLAGVLDRTPVGKVSRVFRDPATGRYMLIKVEGKRTIPLSRVEEMIRRRLYMEKEEEAFDNWIQKQKKEISIEKL